MLKNQFVVDERDFLKPKFLCAIMSWRFPIR